MDRLVKADVEELNLQFVRGLKCCATFKLTNLMHTMSVAVSLTTTNPSQFSFSHSLSILSPLSTSSYTLVFSQTSDHHHHHHHRSPPLSAHLDSVHVLSSMLPTGKAHQDDLRRLFSRPGPHVFKDATIPICFVGPHVVEHLLSACSPKTLEIDFLFAKAISGCSRSQLTSLLRHAAKIGNPFFVSALIEAGADLNSRDAADGMCSAMSQAVKYGNIDVVQVLIESGYVMNNKFDWVLHDAAALDRADIMEILCLGYPDIDVNSVDSNGRTALHVAAIHGYVQVIDFLLSAGTDPDTADKKGWTPLHLAAQEGYLEAVEILLRHSIFSKHVITKEGKTAFAVAVDKGQEHLYDTLQLGDVLHRAARVGDVNAMESCLAEGANVNSKDQNGWTPLHRAAFKGEIECVKVLIRHGAEIDAVNDDGYTSIHLSIEAGHSHVSSYLTGHAKTLKAKIPSDWNCFRNNSAVVKPLFFHEKQKHHNS